MAPKLTKKFYFGYLSETCGYMLSEWLEEEHFWERECNSFLCRIVNTKDTDLLKLSCDSCGDNCIKGRRIDFGGIKNNERAIIDYKQRKISRFLKMHGFGTNSNIRGWS
jgi:hypothetical protein